MLWIPETRKCLPNRWSLAEVLLNGRWLFGTKCVCEGVFELVLSRCNGCKYVSHAMPLFHLDNTKAVICWFILWIPGVVWEKYGQLNGTCESSHSADAWWNILFWSDFHSKAILFPSYTPELIYKSIGVRFYVIHHHHITILLSVWTEWCLEWTYDGGGVFGGNKCKTPPSSLCSLCSVLGTIQFSKQKVRCMNN